MVKTAVLIALAAALVWAQAPPPSATLPVSGDVATPLTLSAGDLAKMPRETASVDGPNGKVQYEGVALREVLAKAGAPMGKQLRGKALSSYVIAKARDGYQVLFSIGEIDADFGNARIIVADKRDGKPLPDTQGPLRLVCPNDHEGARSVRMLESIEVVRLQK